MEGFNDKGQVVTDKKNGERILIIQGTRRPDNRKGRHRWLMKIPTKNYAYEFNEYEGRGDKPGYPINPNEINKFIKSEVFMFEIYYIKIE